MSLRIRATVVAVQVDPFLRDRLLRHLVRLRIDEVLASTPAALGPELTLLVHSPSKTFRDSDPVGQQYFITLNDALTDPYVGSLAVESA